MIDLFEVTDIIGTTSFALSGFLVGVREKLDLLGTVIVAFLTTLGGGLVRDAIVNRPPYSLTHAIPIIIMLSVIALCSVFRIYRKKDFDQRTFFIVTDAIGLVSFSITGSLIAIDADFSIFGVIIIAFLTAVGGGMVRDMLINQVPMIMKKELYGSVAIIIGMTMYILNMLNLINPTNLAIIFILGLIFRLYVYFKKVNLPGF